MYKQIEDCRVNGGSHLVSILNLGNQALTGVFPKTPEENVTVAPIELVWSPKSGLLQLNHSYDPRELYGDTYGYRSGLNQSMVAHLADKARFLQKTARLQSGDVVLDIGSNDGTTLKAYSTTGIRRIGIDPLGRKFANHYSHDMMLIPDFFSADTFYAREKKRARIVSSIAMFYDLENPIEFARQVASILADEGIWHFEQSYMPAMLRLNSYDTICHEHLEYYSLKVVKDILENAGLRLVDVTMNSVNGGSFAVTAAHAASKVIETNHTVINWLLEQEELIGLNTIRPYREFEERVFRHRITLKRLIGVLNSEGKKVLGYGASTKGNVVLQFCGFTSKDIPYIAEVNAEKFGRVTPGSNIPIISESEAIEMKPDYFLVMPWHFKDNILSRNKKFTEAGGKFIFPFPEIEIV